jgi:deoxynucleoside triphosphate triphosphohydrolase SAMHD1
MISLRYFGIIQTGYRRVLETIPDRFSPGPEIPPEESGSLTPPATEPPTTPRSQSRNASFSLTGTGDKTPLGSSSKYLNNAFTTVPPTFAPPSPTRNKKAKGGKRLRDVEGESPHKKRKE